jgi:hypothetical protein
MLDNKHAHQYDKCAFVYTVIYNWRNSSLPTRDSSESTEIFLYTVSYLRLPLIRSVINSCNAREYSLDFVHRLPRRSIVIPPGYGDHNLSIVATQSFSWADSNRYTNLLSQLQTHYPIASVSITTEIVHLIPVKELL